MVPIVVFESSASRDRVFEELCTLPGHKKRLGGHIKVSHRNPFHGCTELNKHGKLGLKVESTLFPLARLTIFSLLRHHDNDQAASHAEVDLIRSVAHDLGERIEAIQAFNWHRQLLIIGIAVLVVMLVSAAILTWLIIPDI